MIVVTGAEQGLGKAILAEADIFFGDTVCMPADVIRNGKEAIDEWIFTNVPDGGDLHWVNNFGIHRLSHIGKTQKEDESILLVNVMNSCYWTVNALVRQRAEPVNILNIASATHRVAQRCSAIYSASKAAIVQLTKVQARELAPAGWRVNCLSPGMIKDTEMSRKVMAQVVNLRGGTEEEWHGYAKKMIPMGRYSNSQEIARAAINILNGPAYMNGSNIEVMGGV